MNNPPTIKTERDKAYDALGCLAKQAKDNGRTDISMGVHKLGDELAKLMLELTTKDDEK